MPKISIFTLGSRGDVQPYIALGRGLARAGFDVEVLTGAEYAAWIAAQSVACQPLDVDMGALAQSQMGREAIAGRRDEAQVELKDQLRRVREQARTSLATRDVVIFHPVVAPFVTRFAKEFSLTLIQAALKPTNPGPFEGNLYGYSRHLIPQVDANTTEVVTGFWFPDVFDPHWHGDPALEDFLALDEATIYVGFGSMSSVEPERVGRLVSDAARTAGVRAVVGRGWGGLARGALDSEHIYWLDEAPHDWLFPRLEAVVHHGGVGTMASALRAGKPMVICPFAIDQPFWGALMTQHGVAPPPLSQAEMSVESLTRAIGHALGSDCVAAAQALKSRLATEDGVVNAVEAITRWIRA